MDYEREVDGHLYLYDVEADGEDPGVAIITIRSDDANAMGAWLVKSGGGLEAVDDREGFAINPLSTDGLWPEPPMEAIEEAQGMARASIERGE